MLKEVTVQEQSVCVVYCPKTLHSKHIHLIFTFRRQGDDEKICK